MGVQKTSIQKTYEMYIRFDSINVDFLSSNTQFDWLEISLVNDKSDKHTIHDSYNVELAAKYIKSIKAQQTKKKNRLIITRLIILCKSIICTRNLLLGTVTTVA